MNIELLALLAAASWGLSSVLLKRGLETSTPMAGTLISTVSTALALLVYILVATPLHRFATPGLPYFILAGLFAPGLARLVSFHGFQRLGVSVNVMLMAGAPMWASLVSVALFGERLTLPIALGTLTIVGGSMLMAGGGAERTWRRIYIILPLAAGFFYGMRDVAARQGLLLDQAPVIAGFITTLVSLVLILAWLAMRGELGQLSCTKSGALFFALAGGCGGFSYIGMFTAFSRGDVVIVSPLVSTHPLFSVIIARIVYGRSERLSPRGLLGSACILAGSMAIGALRG